MKLQMLGVVHLGSRQVIAAQNIGYYPGAKPIHIKLIFASGDGRILGARAVGSEGVEKRIDAISMAIQKQATVFEPAEAELHYAPRFGAAEDPVNLAGMIAANVLRGHLPQADWRELEHTGALLLNVSTPEEFARDHIDGAANIPIGELRNRYRELPRDREIRVNCALGQRAYYAVRFLLQKGFGARHLPGGLVTYWGYCP